MKKYKTPILQIMILSILIGAFYLYTGQNANTLQETPVINTDVILKYGKNPDTFISSQSKNTDLYYTNKNLELKNKLSLENSILGNTVVQTNNKVYVNNFDEITVIGKNESIVFETTMDKYLLSLIYNQQIYVKNVYATDDYYHSITEVKLESTINHPTDASIITQIKNGKRHDVLIYNKVDAITYDEENNEFFVFYTSSQSANSLHMFNDLICVKLKWSKEENNFVLDTTQSTQGHKLSSQGISYFSPIIGDPNKVYFSKEVGLSDKQIYNYYIADFNPTTMNIENEQLIYSKEVKENSTLDVINCFEIKNNLYIFFSDLTYNIINLETGLITEYVVANTGKINSINYTTDGESIYSIFTTNNTISFAEINEGILINRVTVTNKDLGIGLFDNDTIFDFTVIK
ncbi:MAG: hypothetical protein ACK5K7_04875 [Bacilli bacterium]